MREVTLTSKTGFQRRFFKLYLPLLTVGISGLLIGSLKHPGTVRALPAASRIVYSGTYSSADTPAITAASSTPSLNCVADKLFQVPGPITAPGGQAGLIEQFDAPYGHKMYGYSGAQLAALSRQCPLVIPDDSQPYINAYTGYSIAWQYSYEPDGSGACRLLDPQVLIHIQQALPAWQNYSQGSAQLQAEWRDYTAAVAVHEAGHVQLIRQYSAQLLAALQAFPPADCASIKTAADGLGNSYIGQLKQADNSYELSTNYGATQGAIVP